MYSKQKLSYNKLGYRKLGYNNLSYGKKLADIRTLYITLKNEYRCNSVFARRLP